MKWRSGPLTEGLHGLAVIAVAIAGIGWIAIAAAMFAPRAERRTDPAFPQGQARSEGSTAWTARIRAVDAALARRDVGAAELAWHDAHADALMDHGWYGMLAVGDAALRLAASIPRRQAEGWAHGAYMDAMRRAREQRSRDGVLRVADRFAALGDRAMADHYLFLAAGLAPDVSDRDAPGTGIGRPAVWGTGMHDLKGLELRR